MAIRDAAALLARLIDRDPADIGEALRSVRAGEAYERFEIPKIGTKSPRIISAPIEPLKHIQRGLISILEPLSLSSAVHGFRRGRSIVTGARAHLDARALISIDLKDFFHSVDAPRVKRTLNRSLAPRLTDETGELNRDEARAVIDLIVDLATYLADGRPHPVLPQGAPSSPFLANLAARSMDREVRALLDATPGEYVYTRYADDLSISSREEIHRRLLGEILRAIQRRGFAANPQKVRIASTLKGSPHFRQRLEVTGLHLDRIARCVRIPRPRLDLYRMKLHQAALADELSPLERREIEGIVSFVQMVYGSLPGSLDRPYRALTTRHGLTPIRIGKSRRIARKKATAKEIYP